jgi:hypothetical protein
VLARGYDNQEFDFELKRQEALAEALCRGWAKVRLPKIKEIYDIECIEEEWNIPMDGDLTFMTRIDGILTRKSDGERKAIEFKTTGTNQPKHIEAFRYSTQTLTHIWSINRVLKHDVSSVLMEFLYKGRKYQGEIYNPMIRGYKKVGIPPIDSTEYSYDSDVARKKGWEPFYVWEDIGVKAWMEQIPLEVVESHFFGLEVFKNDEEIEQWKRQTYYEVKRIDEGLKELETDSEVVRKRVMDSVFPARMDEDCYDNKYRRSCSYLDICYKQIDDPLGSGKFIVREPHHPQEFEA